MKELFDNLKFGAQCFSLGWSEMKMSLWLETEMTENCMRKKRAAQIYQGFIDQEKRACNSLSDLV